MLTNKEFIEIANSIEEEFPVDALEYKCLKIWPLIRLTLSHLLTSPNTLEPVKLSEREKWSVRDLRHIFIRHYRQHKRLNTKLKVLNSSEKDKVDILYFDAPNESRVLVEDKYFNKLGNSLSIFAKETGFSTKVIEFLTIRKPNAKIYGETYYIDAVIQKANIAYYWKLLREKLFRRKQGHIAHWDELTAFLESKGVTFPYTQAVIIERLEKLLLIRKQFYLFLSKYQPKLIFLNGYYFDIAFAMILAANELSIKTVEFQHGQQGNYHAMYSNWVNYPKEGYEMMPTYFWMWGQQYAESIKKWAKNCKRHEVVVGGNSWLSLNIHNRVKLDEFVGDELPLGKYKKIVLVSLQYSNLPEFLLKAMNLNDDIFWLIRLHPRFINDKETIEAILRNSLLTRNYELRYANLLNIYSLFKVVDIQITFWSTVAYEALSFGVPTILIHKNGKDGMRDYVDKKVFYYTEDKDELLELILNSDLYFNQETVKYIETSESVIKENLKYLMQKS